MKKIILLAALLFSIAQATAAVQINKQPEPQQVSFGQTATFKVEASASPGEPILYQWYFNGVPLNGKTEPTLTIPNVQPENLGKYFVRAGNLNGTQQSTEVTLGALVGADIRIYPAVEVEIPTVLGGKYFLQKSTDLETWIQVGDPIDGTGSFVALLFSSRGGAHTFYRVLERIEGIAPPSLNGITIIYTIQPNGSQFQLAYSGALGAQNGTYVASGSLSDAGNYTYEKDSITGIATVISTVIPGALPARYEMDFKTRTYNKFFQGSLVESGTFTQ